MYKGIAMAKARPTTTTGSGTRAGSAKTAATKAAGRPAPSFPPPTLFNKIAAEFLGTFVLVFGGVGAALFAAGFISPHPVAGAPNTNIGFLGVALAFGLTVLVMCFAVGHISGGHFNSAVTIGLFASGRFPGRDVAPYIISQIVGAIAAAAVLYSILHGKPDFNPGSFASNGYGAAGSPGGYSMVSGLVIEIVLTAVFLFVILGSTDKRGVPKGFAPIAIGLCLTLIHLVAIPVTNTSVNPARSIGPAIMAAIGGDTTPVSQLWLFIVAPIVGALIAGLSYRSLLGKGH